MGKLTKAGFARAKKELGYKGKLTRKQVQRVFKRAIKKLGRKASPKSKSRTTKSKTTSRKTTKKSTKKGGNKRMGRNLQATMFKWLRIAALVGPGAYQAIKWNKTEDKLRQILIRYTGYDVYTGEFKLQYLAEGYGPYLATVLATYGIPKIAGIIRKL